MKISIDFEVEEKKAHHFELRKVIYEFLSSF
jgi:hypothetical protein